MSVLELNRAEFHSLASKVLGQGHRVRFQASGGSMQPFILDGDILEAAPLAGKRIHCGDVLLITVGNEGLLVHRVIKTDQQNGITNYLIKGDAYASPDGWYGVDKILGRVEFVEHGSLRINMNSESQKLRGKLWVTIAPWVTKFTWLPERYRRLARQWLLAR